ncbi:CapA family protein, partial [candidate division WOR-3 bacterium]|nr:CapA family protein [candidate division WOR-3 bacterium]
IEFAHTMIDAGADLVIGHGPHVPRGMEVYEGKLIAYSLGNFCTYRCMQLTGELGYAPLLVVEVDSIGNFLRGEIHSFRQFPPGGPTKDTTEAVFNLMWSLSVTDFETSAPSFSENLSFYPPADSDLSVEEIEAVRDSLDALSIVEPDTATPEVTESVDSFLTVIQEEQDTSDVSDEDLPHTTSSAKVPSTPEDADSVAVPEPDSANRFEGE